MDKCSRSIINEEEHKFVAHQKHDSKSSSSVSSESIKKSKSSSSSSSNRHHSSLSKHQVSSTTSHRSNSSSKKSEHRAKDHKKSSDSKSSENKHHKSHHSSSSSSHKSHKRSREEIESKHNEQISKKTKTDHEKKSNNIKDINQSSSRSSKHLKENHSTAKTESDKSSSYSSSSSKSKSSSSSKKDKQKEKSSTSSKPAEILIQTPELLTQKPKLDLSPDLVNDLNVSTFDFLQPLSKSPNNESSMQIQQNRVQSESELLTKSISSIKSRTRIFSGNTRAGSKIPKLTDMCLKVLTDNLDFVECIGDIPFDILRPALEKAKPEQLTKIEYYNPYLLDDSDILWKTICQRKWRNRQPVEMESWREMYERCNQEDEEKLNRLTKSIRQTQEKSSNCVQKTKMAFMDAVKAPKRVFKKPEQFSSIRKPVISLAARIETLKSSKPNFAVPGDVRSRVASSVRDDAQPIVRKGATQRPNSVKTAPMMAKLISKFRR